MSMRSSGTAPSLGKAWPCHALAIVVAVLPLLAGCASPPPPEPDEVVDRIIADDAAKAAAADPVDKTYPDLRSVPPRPQLGYSVEQRRQIQGALVGDLAYAKRTSDLVRTTEGAIPPPPPEPPAIEPAQVGQAAPKRMTAPPKVELIERRDTSGNLSGFLDDVVGLNSASDTAGQPSLVPSTRGSPSGQLPLAGSPSDPTVTEPGAATVDVTGPTASATDVGSPLEIGRIWLFPLRSGADEPAVSALQPVLDAVSRQDALLDRHLSVTGRSPDRNRALRLANAVVADLVDQGVSPGRIEVNVDRSTPGEAVLVSVLQSDG